MEGTAALALAASFDRLVAEPAADFAEATEEDETDDAVCEVAEGVEVGATEEVGLTNEDSASLGELAVSLVVDFGAGFLSLLYRPRRFPILTNWGSTFST